MSEVRVIYQDLPVTVRGFVCMIDGYYTIVINARMSRPMQEMTYHHEMEHIRSGDFDRQGCADAIERERHKT